METNNAELLILSYPVFAPDDSNLIQEIRQRLDPETEAIFPPHFTQLLPLDSSWERSILSAAESVSKKTNSIEFTIKTLVILDNPESGENFLVLAPEEPAALLELHLLIYDEMGLPAPYGNNWRPHITLAVSTDREMLIAEAKQLKSKVAGIRGVVDSIEVISWSSGEVKRLTSYSLEPA